MTEPIVDFLDRLQPYSDLTPEDRAELAATMRVAQYAAGDQVYSFGDRLDGLYIVRAGDIEVRDEHGETVSLLGPRNTFGERGLERDGRAATSAYARSATELLVLPAASFRLACDDHPALARFFDRSAAARPTRAPLSDLATSQVAQFMARDPLTVPPKTTATEAARRMRDARVSCLCVVDADRLVGIVTIRDLSARIVAESAAPDTPVSAIMTADPRTLPPEALGSDVLHMMLEQRIGHVPIVSAQGLVGIVTQTDLTRFQAMSSAELVAGIAHAKSAADMAETTARIPRLLSQLVAGHHPHEVTTRLITDIADAVTRRLLRLAERDLGPPPVPYLWLACGSQGRQEQTGVSDQDNCLILSDEMRPEHDSYFEALARYVSDGLNTCGYVYCPGDMMATNPRWRQPLATWRRYFKGWIDKPVPEAQMLASVMFDLRPIGGDTALFDGLQEETLAQAAKNSIFVSHMISNALKHQPPLGLIRGFATIRKGENKDRLDLKHSGVVPVTDLARVYALRGELRPVNTRARIVAAREAKFLSKSGGQDLLDAYDLIAETRLEHQCRLIREGKAPDNFLPPSKLSDFDRAHLRDAFVVVKGLQSALGHGRGMLS
ncbi:DUF294 nucleotidyltransferase-like domain-containing protein [Roseivivax sp. THAF197b]|uniref:DUF294 nucleotidyltransferase-like domain-containing protein n=1 Tax=Roseivivax sp. THAF197b TaxID=2588299 RepID=UPI001268D211|nr:DUF294 nucleotidyltransferase-like domain-containing protein [Roseivivax sp. THAF197b]QFS83089.1 Glycine betaine/carnitine/choline transport ATP-binding protein OpuCA [Roseivivax sp. THAF197b]